MPRVARHRDGPYRALVWVPAEKSLRPSKRRAHEIQVGRRAIDVGGIVIDEYHQSSAAMDRFRTDPPLDHGVYDAAYMAELHRLQTTVGARWSETLMELRNIGAIGAGEQSGWAIATNFTGLDRFALQVQAIGRQLMRKHGEDPDA